MAGDAPKVQPIDTERDRLSAQLIQVDGRFRLRWRAAATRATPIPLTSSGSEADFPLFLALVAVWTCDQAPALLLTHFLRHSRLIRVHT